jgi:3-hydroxyphenylacetate 6-hydroxylase
VADSEVDTHPVTGSVDPTSLVTMCRDYKVKLKPRDESVLRMELEKADRRLRAFDEA